MHSILRTKLVIIILTFQIKKLGLKEFEDYPIMSEWKSARWYKRNYHSYPSGWRWEVSEPKTKITYKWIKIQGELGFMTTAVQWILNIYHEDFWSRRLTLWDRSVANNWEALQHHCPVSLRNRILNVLESKLLKCDRYLSSATLRIS